MAAPSRRINNKLDSFNPLMCCDESIAHRGYNPYLTTYDKEFYNHENIPSVLDSLERSLRYKQRDEGVYPSKLLIGDHANKPREQNYNTQYCEDFNNLPRKNILPPTRYFNVHKGKRGSWEPEKICNSLIGEPWNYGYIERKRAQWKKEEDELNRIARNDQYWPESCKYSRYAEAEYKSQRRATSLSVSSKFHNPRTKISRGPPSLFQPNQITQLTKD